METEQKVCRQYGNSNGMILKAIGEVMSNPHHQVSIVCNSLNRALGNLQLANGILSTLTIATHNGRKPLNGVSVKMIGSVLMFTSDNFGKLDNDRTQTATIEDHKNKDRQFDETMLIIVRNEDDR